MADDKTLELKLIARDMLSAVVEGAQKSIGGLAEAVKDGARGVAGAWPSVAQGINAVKEKYDTLKGTAGMALDVLQTGWNLLIEPGLEAARITAQTEAVIKSTGGTAGLTADEIGNLAGAMSRLSGGSDEAIQSGENMLLTFTGIGKDIFPRVTQAMTDMAVSMAEGDVQAADFRGTALQLGKALNDPAQGLAALSRAGVSFSEAQKAAIKQMVAVNDIGGAQALMLAELEKEFGGAAKAAGDTLPGKLAKAQNAIDNMRENLANMFIPVVGQAADAFNTLVTGRDQLSDAFRASQASIQADLVAGKMSLDDYNNAIAGMAQNVSAWDAATGTALQTQYTLTQAQLDGLQAAQRAAAEQKAYNDSIMAFDAVGDGGAIAAEFFAQAVKDKATADAIAAERAKLHADAIAQQAQIARDNQQAIADYANTVGTLAMRLKDATDAEAKQELAKAGTEALKEARDKGVITNDQYLSSLTNLQLGYGLATEKSLAMGEAQATLNQLLEIGAIPADTYVASIGNIPAAARDGKVSLDELVTGGINPAQIALADASTATSTLRDALDKLPRRIKIEIALEQMGNMPHFPASNGTGSGKALGGTAAAYTPYWVGEHGPEPFIPAVDGRILSRRDAMDALARSGGSSSPVINVSIAATMTSDHDIEETAYRISEIIGRNLQSYS